MFLIRERGKGRRDALFHEGVPVWDGELRDYETARLRDYVRKVSLCGIVKKGLLFVRLSYLLRTYWISTVQ